MCSECLTAFYALPGAVTWPAFLLLLVCDEFSVLPAVVQKRSGLGRLALCTLRFCDSSLGAMWQVAGRLRASKSRPAEGPLCPCKCGSCPCGLHVGVWAAHRGLRVPALPRRRSPAAVSSLLVTSSCFLVVAFLEGHFSPFTPALSPVGPTASAIPSLGCSVGTWQRVACLLPLLGVPALGGLLSPLTFR